MKYRSLAGLALLVAAAACSGDSTGSGSGPITVSPDPVTVAVGDTVRLSVSSSGQTVTFRSLNPSIATVTGTGLVTGVAVGTAQVVAEGGGQSDTVTVNVVAGGATRTLNVNTDQACAEPLLVGFRTAAEG